MVHVVSKKATMNRERVRKHRRNLKSRISYENAVRAEIKRREKIESKEDAAGDIPTEIPDSENTYTFNQEMSDFKEKLVCWSVKHCVTKRALNDLLTILIIYGFNFLPKDSRTLMKTPTTIDIRALSKGQMWYHGLQKNLHSIFNKVRRSGIALSSTIHLDFNFDGVELFNSSKKCFWPIIASIRGIFESIHVFIIHELF